MNLPAQVRRHWGWWVVMAVVSVTLLVVAGGRAPDSGTGDDRLFAIAERLKCLQCVGESAAASQAPAAEKFREEIRDQMAGGSTDDEILNYFAERYGEEVLLDPPTSGAGLLVWVLPAAALAGVVVGLAMAFARWRTAPEVPPRPEEARAAVLAGGTAAPDPGTRSTGAAGEGPAIEGAGGPDASTRTDGDGGSSPWRRVALGGALLGVVVLAVWAVVWGSSERGDGNLTGADVAGGSALARCQPAGPGDPDAAIDCFDEVLAEEPDDVEALTYRGWAELRAGDVEAASADLDRAVELAPTYPDARVFRAVLATRVGDYEAATEELAVFWANEPSDAAVSVVRSEGLEREIFFGLMSQATRSCWQEAASGGGDSIDQEFLDVLGSCLDPVIAADPADRTARLSRALSLVGPERSDVAAARALLDSLLEEDPSDSDALALLVSLDLAAGDLDAAARGLGELEELDRGPAAFLIGDAETLRSALAAARRETVPNPDGG